MKIKGIQVPNMVVNIDAAKRVKQIKIKTLFFPISNFLI